MILIWAATEGENCISIYITLPSLRLRRIWAILLFRTNRKFEMAGASIKQLGKKYGQLLILLIKSIVIAWR